MVYRLTRSALVLTVLTVLAALAPVPTAAQGLAVGDPMEDYLRVLQVAGLADGPSLMVRPLRVAGPTAVPGATHPWAATLPAPASDSAAPGLGARLDPAELRVSGNSSLPFGHNDGAQWQGKGLNLALDAGATARWGALRLSVHPTLIAAQNLAFPLAPVDRPGAGAFAYPWRQIDLPQRPGPDAQVRLDPGQSVASATWGSAVAGFGTQNLWWGPGREHSILIGNNAPGFPHAFLASARPVDVRIGTLEGQWIWGRLQESGWYLEEDAGQGRFVTGAVVVYSPSFLAGLSLGGGRIFVTDVPPEGLGVADYLSIFQPGSKQRLRTPENPTGNDYSDQMASFLARWVLPASGFEVYGEWARNDHFGDFRDLMLEPDHSQGYTLGFHKVEALSGTRLLSFGGELTHLEQSKTLLVRSTPKFYAHHYVLRGYTQRGQVIGAALGPGGNGGSLRADLFTPAGRLGVYVARQAHDNDAFYGRAGTPTELPHWPDVSLAGGARALVFARGLEIGFDAALTYTMNRNFTPAEDVWNVHGGVSARWRPR